MTMTRARWVMSAYVLLVLATQVVNMAVFKNHLRHLTNWAWVFNGLVGLIYIIKPRGYRAVILTPIWGVVTFVAAGVTYIHSVDDTMLRAIRDDIGPLMFWVGDMTVHYLPVLVWTWILFYVERANLCDEILLLPAGDALFKLNLPALLLLLVYPVWFNPSHEYNGAGLVFTELFGLSIAVTTLATLILVVFTTK